MVEVFGKDLGPGSSAVVDVLDFPGWSPGDGADLVLALTIDSIRG